jgi:hypothetical protein
MPTYHVTTFGCQMNVHDSERMQGMLESLGYEAAGSREEADLIQKSGSFFSYGETRLGQGRNNAKQFLADNPELAGEIEGKIRAALGIGGDAAPAPAPAEEKPPVAEVKAA